MPGTVASLSAPVCAASIPIDEDARGRAGEYCVSTAPFRPTRACRVALESTVYAQHFFERPLRRAGEYCVRTAPFRETVASRRGVLCKHSTFSTDATASRCAAEYCVSTAPFRPTQPRSTFRPTVLRRAGGSTVYAQHLFDRRDRRRVARQSTVYAQHLFDRRE